jgi:hypothetical protein
VLVIGIAVLNRNPLQWRAQVMLHLRYHRAGMFSQIDAFVIIGTQDQAPMDLVLCQCPIAGGKPDIHVIAGGVKAEFLVPFFVPVALEIASMRLHQSRPPFPAPVVPDEARFDHRLAPIDAFRWGEQLRSGTA